MRRTPLTAVLVIATLAGVSPACVAGWGAQGTSPCRATADRAHTTSKTAASCRRIVKPESAKCGLRTFIQFQIAQFHSSGFSNPLIPVNEYVPAENPRIIVTSIGPPETDRGPPAPENNRSLLRA
jgi:hypothetical protein